MGGVISGLSRVAMLLVAVVLALAPMVPAASTAPRAQAPATPNGEEVVEKPADRRVGDALTREERARMQRGSWRVGPSVEERPDAEELERLQAIGYLAGSEPADAYAGKVPIYDREQVWDGVNVYCSGHGPEALLVGMDGAVLHRWHRSFEACFPDRALRTSPRTTSYWRRIYVYPNGDLLAIFEGLGLVKLDRDSNVIWARSNGAHHDLTVTDEGDIYVLTREARVIPDVNPNHPILEDFVAVLDASGEEKRRVSVLDALRHSPFADVWEQFPKRRDDIFHTNTLYLIPADFDSTHTAFAPGRVLTSSLMLNMIGVIDLDAEAFVWLQRGRFLRQHDPRLLDNGNVLVFDNRGGNRGSDRSSRVTEFRLSDFEPVWEYAGSEAAPFYSHTCGAARRLPNGNTVIVESDAGRAFEVTRDKEIVWAFHNPNRAGDHDEYIAALFDLIRLPADFGAAWRSSE